MVKKVKVYTSKIADEAIMAYRKCMMLDIHAKIIVRITKEINGEIKATKTIETSVGRIISTTKEFHKT